MKAPKRIPRPIRAYLSGLQVHDPATYDRLKGHYGLLIDKLFHDTRMRKVWCNLSELELSDEQLVGFFCEALTAHQNYQTFRVIAKEEIKLRRKISQTAQKLSDLLKEAERLEYLDRDALHVPGLIRLRPNGYQILEKLTGGKYVSPTEPTLRLSDILETLASDTSADKHFSTNSPSVDAAISSRKHHPAMEYIRALWTPLLDPHGVERSLKVAEALSITAGVVLDIEKPPEPTNVLNTLPRPPRKHPHL